MPTPADPPGGARPEAGARHTPLHAASRRGLRALAALLIGISLVQYLQQGSITWPARVAETLLARIHEVVSSPSSGWRQAAAQMDRIGAAREGKTAPTFDLTGRIVRVADGDTVSLLDADNRQHRVRLFGIDTPEQNQPYGNAAKRALLALVGQKTVGVVVATTDDYGRTVGTLYLEGANINHAMVAQGYAWWYRHFAPHERTLAAAEEQARKQRLGLWADAHPVPPWDWRRGRRASTGER